MSTRSPGRFQRPTPDIDEIVSGMRRSLDARSAVPAQPRLDPDEILRRVRVEVANRRGLFSLEADMLGSDHSLGQLDGGLTRWRSSAVPDTARREFVLPELLEASDETFVATAYRALLRREPDQGGLTHYLGLLRTGAMSKVEVLGELRWSHEGRARSVHVDGLLAPYMLQKWQRKPLIGPIIGWTHALLRLGTLSRRQQMYDAAAARESHGLGSAINHLALQLQSRLEELDDLQAQNALALSEKLAALQAELDMRAGIEALAESERHLRQLASTLDSHVKDTHSSLGLATARLELLQSQLELLRPLPAALQAAERLLGNLAEQFNQLKSTSQTGSEQLVRHQEILSGHDQELAVHRSTLHGYGAALNLIDQAKASELERAHALDPLYVALENKFRGSNDLIRTRSEPYLTLVREAGLGSVDAPVLDLGCGRGEWLELLRDNGLVGRGVDSNRVFIDLCKGCGLDVIEGDVIEVMQSLPDDSMGAITGIHIAEHLPFEVLVQLLDEARRLLKPGGLLALETPNPENLQVATHFFYMDPTHRNPLPPEALRWLVEARGFDHARIERWTVARETGAPPLLDAGIPGAESMNVLLSQLHAPLDYSIVARRGTG